ncbi:MAG: FkbM family methyltransferase [Oscillospiraceae bacterium]|nr:FkbM family methyltransferase [Oscillospiraceae bacterium]
MRFYTKILRFLLRDLYARNEAARTETQNLSAQLHQNNQELQDQIEQLKNQNRELMQELMQSQNYFQDIIEQSNTAHDERAERSEKRLDCLEHYRSETEKRMQSDDVTTLEISHRTEQIESALREHQILPNALELFNKKTYSQAGEDAIILYACAMLGIPLNQCSYLDLGANQPVAMSNTCFFYEQGARGVLLEANPLLIPDLKHQRSGDVILNQAVSDVSGETVIFNILNLDGLSKIGDVSDILAKNPAAKLEKSIEIKTISYNAIIEKYFDKQAPVILNLDIEGLEMQILRSMNLKAYRPLFIIIEMIPYSQKLSAGIKDQELLDYLVSENYIEYAFTGINSIFIDKIQYEKFIA